MDQQGVESSGTDNGCLAIGLELGTSSSKFCADDTIVLFSSVIGDPLSSRQEKSWRLMNRSQDRAWIRNLAIFDDNRSSWRYVGAMTRNSEKLNWFTSKGVVQNFDDAFTSLKAGLFLLDMELKKNGKPGIKKAGLGFGIVVHLGEDVADNFFNYIKDKLSSENNEKFIVIKAKNVATDEEEELKINISFTLMQYQAYGAYMAMLFSKYEMNVYNTYIIDIGHGTWIKLPVIDNEVDVLIADSFSEGIHTITKNISESIFEMSSQKFKIPEQKINEKIPRGDFTIEVPGSGIYDFKGLLEEQCDHLAQIIIQHVRNDVKAISAKGEAIDYFVIIGGGAHLLYERLKDRLKSFFEWDAETADERIINSDAIDVDPRYLNCLGFMLLARDHIALENGGDVDSNFGLSNIVTDSKPAVEARKTK
ncbi:MAG: ParM/StbA family protein [Candidatus Anammoxibacter sp.]